MKSSSATISSVDRQLEDNNAEPIVLVLAADDCFAMPMTVTLYSVLTHLPAAAAIEVYILDAGISLPSKERIRRVASRSNANIRLHWVEPDLSLFGNVKLKALPRLGLATFYRLLIPEVLPSSVERSLYLDSDVIVEEDLTALWQTDLDGHPLAAVQERLIGCPRYGVGDWKRLGLDPKGAYFNAGVLLIDVEKWRARNLHRKVISFFLDPELELRFPSDQEGLNATLAGQWLSLDPRWNAVHNYYLPESWAEISDQVSVTAPQTVAEEARIIHFTSEYKPWLPRCPHPRRDRFRYYLRKSGWFSPREYAVWTSKFHCRDWYGTLRKTLRPYRIRLNQQFLQS